MTTRKGAKWLREILKGTSHDLPCACPVCLHATYRKKVRIKIKIQNGASSEETRGLNGRPFSPLAFFIRYWIARGKGIDEAKTIISIVQADNAYEITPEDIHSAVHRHRDERIAFERLLIALENERHRAWIEEDPEPANEWKRDPAGHAREDSAFFREIVGFVRAQDKPTTLRDIKRHFRTKGAAEIERALEWRFLDPTLRAWTRRKSRVFLWRPLTTDLVSARNKNSIEWANRVCEASTAAYDKRAK